MKKIEAIIRPHLLDAVKNALQEVGIAGSPREAALRLAKLAADCALDGVVCSAQEASWLRAQCGPEFLLVTPGIRLQENDPDDQKRTATPAFALAHGANYLVVGRPITRAADPLGMLREMAAAGGLTSKEVPLA